MKNLTTEQRAWAAGIMDGEGSFMLSYRPPTTTDVSRGKWGSNPKRHLDIPDWEKYPRRTPGYIKICSMANTSLSLLKLFQSWFGGSVATVKMPEDTNQKQLYVWRISDTNLVKQFCESVKPYLFLKRRHAEILLEFCSTINPSWRNVPVKPDILEYRYKIYKELRVLNRRGRTAAETKRKDGIDLPKR